MVKTTRRTALGALAAGLAAPALAQQRAREIRLVSTFPLQLGGLGDCVKRIGQTITQHSGGRLNVTVYAPGALMGPFDVHDAVGNGDAEMYFTSEYYFQKKSRAFNFFSTVPMGLTMMELSTWVHRAGAQALWDELSAKHGVKAFFAGGTGPQTGGWFREEIKSVEDFREITMRMPGLGGEVLERFGAKAVLLPGGKIVSAYRDGQIDAMEWVGPWNDLQFGFQKLMQTYMFPGFHEPGTMASIGINLDLWNDLSPQDRALIATAGENEELLHTADYHANNSFSLRRLAEEYGTKPSEMPFEVFEGLARAAEEVVAEVAGDGELEARIYNSYAAFRESVAGGVAARDLAAFIEQRDESASVL